MVKTAFSNTISFLIDCVSYVFHFFSQNEFLSIVLGSFIFLFFLNILVSIINSRGKTNIIKPLQIFRLLPLKFFNIFGIKSRGIQPIFIKSISAVNSRPIIGLSSGRVFSIPTYRLVGSWSSVNPISVPGVRGLSSTCIEGIGSTPVRSNASGNFSFDSSYNLGSSLGSLNSSNKAQKEKELQIQAAEAEKQQADKEHWDYQHLLNNSSGQAKKEIKQAWIDKHRDKYKS